GIEERGKSTVGEKTMLDTLVPASEAFNTAAEKGCNLEECFQQAYIAGKKGMEYTKNIKATKGRASYLGDRSIGTLDPGAVSSYLILETIKEEI
ncbi:MAG: dihydroxyacetone kinase subunit L, partial [Cetobacterium sp.]|uniref:dihydroxyacetone kinase subunit L n=1 Tax=Cetobacterium sp. TaxID=2071632 RepID=UPI002FCADDC7